MRRDRTALGGGNRAGTGGDLTVLGRRMGELEEGESLSREKIQAAMRAKIQEALARVAQAYQHRPPDLDQAEEDRLIDIMARLQELQRHIDALFEEVAGDRGGAAQGIDPSAGNPASSQANKPPRSA